MIATIIHRLQSKFGLKNTKCNVHMYEKMKHLLVKMIQSMVRTRRIVDTSCRRTIVVHVDLWCSINIILLFCFSLTTNATVYYVVVHIGQ